jgi:hypothetical protein
MEISEPRLRNLLRQAERNAANGKLAAAESLYRQIVEEAPEAAVAWVGLAGVLNDLTEKQAAFERALTLEPDNAAAQAGLVALKDAGRPADSGPVMGPAVGPAIVDTAENQATITHAADADEDVVDVAEHEAILPARVKVEPVGQPAVESYELFCYRHPDRPTSLRCYNCNRPICIKCANKTPVGYICPECMREAEDTFFNSRPLDYLIAAAVSFPLSLLIGWLLIYVLAGGFGFFYYIILFFVSGAVGGFIGRLSKRAIGNRRGRYLPQLVVAMMILGVLIPALPIFLFVVAGQPGALLALAGPAIYLFVGGGAAYWQMR